MTLLVMTDLSPAAKAVLDAYLRAPCDNNLSVAATLIAVADQVVPANGSRRNNEIRAEILAIAAELQSL